MTIENIELYNEEKAEFEVDDDCDDFEISLPLWQLNEYILNLKMRGEDYGEGFDTCEEQV